MRRWSKHLSTNFPNLRFEVQRVSAREWPRIRPPFGWLFLNNAAVSHTFVFETRTPEYSDRLLKPAGSVAELPDWRVKGNIAPNAKGRAPEMPPRYTIIRVLRPILGHEAGLPGVFHDHVSTGTAFCDAATIGLPRSIATEFASEVASCAAIEELKTCGYPASRRSDAEPLRAADPQIIPAPNHQQDRDRRSGRGHDEVGVVPVARSATGYITHSLRLAPVGSEPQRERRV